MKLRAGMSNKYALLNEWIGNKLGNQLGIKIQSPVWFESDDKIATKNTYIEVKELIEKSLGFNIGFDFKEHITEIQVDELELCSHKDLIRIFLFDLMMVNVDRTLANTNLIRFDNTIFSIDYESSLLVQSIIEDKNFLENSRVLQCFRNNPLYQEIEENEVNEFLAITHSVSLDLILSEIPESLLNKKTFNLLKQGIEKRKEQDWSLKEILSKLKSLQPENQDEQKAKRKMNQAKFKKNLKANALINRT